MTPRLLLTTDRSMLAHDPGHERRAEHPERPARLSALLEQFVDTARPEYAVESESPSISRAQLELVHGPDHVSRILAARGRAVQFDPDTGTSPGSVDAALRAVAHAVGGVRRIFDDGPTRSAFALVRPPGHHAEPNRAMGFCLFHNLAIAIEVARREFGVRRVLVVDWDVHHGNGSQVAFYERSDVLVFDVHQAPLFPGTGSMTDRGRAAGEGYTLNLPLPAGLGDAEYLALFHRLLLPVADAFEPDLVALSAGFDAHADDPLGGMRVTAPGFGELARIVRTVADRHASGRMIATLEGGYDLAALVACSRACVDVFSRAETPALAPAPESPGATIAGVLAAAIAIHGPRWPIEGA